MSYQNNQTIVEERKEKTILIVEDDPDIQELYSLFFRMSSWKVLRQISDGIESLKFYQALKRKPNVVLLDANVPFFFREYIFYC